MTSLPHNLLVGMNRMRTLQLDDNPLSCDCAAGWLSRWLRGMPRLIAHARCFSPQHLRGQNLLELHDIDFKCSGIFYSYCKCLLKIVSTYEVWIHLGDIFEFSLRTTKYIRYQTGNLYPMYFLIDLMSFI